MSSLEDLFGPVIHSYSRAQAIDDGVLVDVTDVAKEAGFLVPVAMTRAAWADMVAWRDGNRALQDEAGRLWDVLTMAHHFARRNKTGSHVVAEVLRVPNTPRATVPRLQRFQLVVGPGDTPEPVMTIMLMGED